MAHADIAKYTNRWTDRQPDLQKLQRWHCIMLEHMER